jgi:hypothetical protein
LARTAVSCRPGATHRSHYGPGGRFDIVIDFSDVDGKFFVLNNDAKAHSPMVTMSFRPT